MRRTAGPEAILLRACLDLLELQGISAFRLNSGRVKVGRRLIRLAPEGSSDIVGVLPGGRFLAVETKAPTGRLTPAQRAFLDTVAAAGGAAVVVRDVAELARLLDRLREDPDADIPREAPVGAPGG